MPGPSSDQFGFREMFFADCPPEFLRAFVGGIMDCYRTSWTFSEARWPDDVARQTHPQVCRGDIEAFIRTLGVAFPGVVTANPIHNEVNHGSHVEVIAGRMRLTQCIVAHPHQPVADAAFRRNNAEASRPPLPGFGEPANRGTTYAVFLTGADRADRSVMAFGQVIFPGKNCQDVLHRIDLLDWYMNNVADDAAREQVADPAVGVRTTGRRLPRPLTPAMELGEPDA
jgi:hypothetical protein